MRDKYIERCSVFNITSRTMDEVYRLSAKGQELCRSQLALDHFYRSNSVAHDLSLADRYFSLSEAERSTWITESQFREILNDSMKWKNAWIN